MSDVAYSERHTRDLLHAMRQRIAAFRSALQSVRHESIARGDSESQFAAKCGLSLEALHDMIGSYESYRQAVEASQ